MNGYASYRITAWKILACKRYSDCMIIYVRAKEQGKKMPRTGYSNGAKLALTEDIIANEFV